jgi:hypothetical protein
MWKERDWPALRTKLDQLKTLGATQRNKLFTALGLNKIEFAFDPEYIPHVNPIKIAPQDCLHLFPDGLLRSEGAWLFYILFCMGLSMEDANRALRKYKGFPPDVRSSRLTACYSCAPREPTPTCVHCVRCAAWASCRYSCVLLCIRYASLHCSPT